MWGEAALCRFLEPRASQKSFKKAKRIPKTAQRTFERLPREAPKKLEDNEEGSRDSPRQPQRASRDNPQNAPNVGPKAFQKQTNKCTLFLDTRKREENSK